MRVHVQVEANGLLFTAGGRQLPLPLITCFGWEVHHDELQQYVHVGAFNATPDLKIHIRITTTARWIDPDSGM